MCVLAWLTNHQCGKGCGHKTGSNGAAYDDQILRASLFPVHETDKIHIASIAGWLTCDTPFLDDVILHYDTLPHVVSPSPSSSSPSIAQGTHVLSIEGHAVGGGVEVNPELIQSLFTGLVKLNGRTKQSK